MRSLAKAFQPEQWADLQARVQQLPKPFRSYAHSKLRLDPVYLLELAELPWEGELLDLGTGIGLLPLLLGLLRPALRVRGVEWDARKAGLARQMLGGLASASVEEADARTHSLGSPNAIAMLDILHYSPAADARRWLEACARALAPGGVLLIRALEPGRFAVAPWLEWVSVRMKWNRGDAVYPRPSSELARDLTHLGLTVVRRPAGVGLFRDNTLTIARRLPASHGR
jgi:SAM-dependent methyltransferase